MTAGRSWPRPQVMFVWSERWQAPEKRLHSIEAILRAHRQVILRGGDYDRWDLVVGGGMLGSARPLMAIEEHGAGTQFLRFRWWPTCSTGGVTLTSLFAALSTGAVLDQAWPASIILGLVTGCLAFRMLQECEGAMTAILRALEDVRTAEARSR